jgi:hypothetical protein
MGTLDRGSQATNSTVALRAMVDKFPGGHRREVTPVPIPNTEVKLSTADGTAWATAWESRSLPGLFSVKRAVASATALFLSTPNLQRPTPRRWTSPRAAGTAAALAALFVSLVFLRVRPDLAIGAGFLFGDESANLLVADALHRGRELYRDIAYPYGPIPILLVAGLTTLFPNVPLTYLVLLAILSAISAGMAIALVRRAADARLALAVFVVGLLPTLPLPGATIGGYISTPYIPLERICLLAAALCWRQPAGRATARGLTIGMILGICQGVRFGSGAVVLAAVAAIDSVILSRHPSPGRLRVVLRNLLTLGGGFALAELCWGAWALLAVGGPTGLEFLWPVQLWQTHQSTGMPRWPTWAGGRMFVAQQLMPLVAATLGITGFLRWMRTGKNKPAAMQQDAPFYILFAFYVMAALLYFRHEHHFRQFAWILVLSAVPLLRRVSRPVLAGLVLVVSLPALWPLVSALTHRPAPDMTEVRVRRGYVLRLDALNRRKLTFLDGAVLPEHEPVLFVPNGAGWLYGSSRAYVGRHTWFYSSAVLREFEVETFLGDLRSVRTIVFCRPYPSGRVPLPVAAYDAIERDFPIVATSDDCDIRRRRSASFGP